MSVWGNVCKTTKLWGKYAWVTALESFYFYPDLLSLIFWMSIYKTDQSIHFEGALFFNTSLYFPSYIILRESYLFIAFFQVIKLIYMLLLLFSIQ